MGPQSGRPGGLQLMQKLPLLLLHGICNNSNLFSFSQSSLGSYLSEYFDIFPVDYPVYENRNRHWDFDFHLYHDLPVIWEQICQEAGAKPCVFGYSMGGMLAMVAQAQGVIDAPAVITAASPFNFGMMPLYPPLMRTWVRLASLTGYKMVPIKVLGRILCSLLTAAVPGHRMGDLNLFRHLIKTAAINVPVETFLQALTWTKTRKLTDRTGKIDYLSTFPNIKTPVCLIYGSKDRVAPQRTVEAGYNAVSSRRKAIFSIPDGTHMNMTIGKNARLISEITRAWCCSDDEDSEDNQRPADF